MSNIFGWAVVVRKGGRRWWAEAARLWGAGRCAIVGGQWPRTGRVGGAVSGHPGLDGGAWGDRRYAELPVGVVIFGAHKID